MTNGIFLIIVVAITIIICSGFHYSYLKKELGYKGDTMSKQFSYIYMTNDRDLYQGDRFFDTLEEVEEFIETDEMCEYKAIIVEGYDLKYYDRT